MITASCMNLKRKKMQQRRSNILFYFMNFHSRLSIVPAPRNLRKYRMQEAVWISTLNDWEHQYARNKRKVSQLATMVSLGLDKIKELCRMGLPDSLRARIWSSLSGADKIKREGAYQVSFLSITQLTILQLGSYQTGTNPHVWNNWTRHRPMLSRPFFVISTRYFYLRICSFQEKHGPG